LLQTLLSIHCFALSGVHSFVCAVEFIQKRINKELIKILLIAFYFNGLNLVSHLRTSSTRSVASAMRTLACGTTKFAKNFESTKAVYVKKVEAAQQAISLPRLYFQRNVCSLP
ncbi:MAG: hypothetical protein LUC23_06045, partial [Prevotellaceae bacterium]|nr:hypothetical protein [Prevotellaceae bacterium]